MVDTKSRLTGALALAALACLAHVCHVRAQQPGTVSGVIVDATSGAPLRGAVVLLEPRPAGSLRVSGSEKAWSAALSVFTNGSGSYRFGDVAHGLYRLLVRRMGYRPATIYIDLSHTRRLDVSVGLTVQPIRLERAVGTALAPPAVRASRPNAVPDPEARVFAEKARQQLFLESDVRLLSESDVAEAVTLAEGDVLRALQRLPGVTTRDEYTAELWTRGAPWSQTLVLFDGLPLYNPVHSAGVFSGVNPDGLGTVFFHPGSRPASIGEGAAGVLSLRSRRWNGDDLGGVASVSLASARLLLGGPLPNNGAWSVATRRSYADLLAGVLLDSTSQFPYAFFDLTGRADLVLGGNAVAEASFLWGRDHVWGTVPDLLRDNKGRWGNAAGQFTLSAQSGPFLTKHTLGFSRFDGNMSVVQYVSGVGTETATPTHAPIENRLFYLVLKSTIEPSAGSTGKMWGVGYDLEYQRQRFLGPYPRPYPTIEQKRTFGRWAELLRLAVWAEKRFTFGPLTLHTGLRTEFVGAVANTAPFGIAPRLSARYAPAPRVSVSASLSRTYQYTQAIAPAGPGIGPDLHVSDVWLLAGDTIPAIRSDVRTLGAEAWLGEGLLGSVTLYTREATGVAIPDPTPGARALDSSIFVPASNRASGLELSLRRLVGPLTASLAYAFGVSEMSAAGRVFPSTAARLHALDATATTKLGRSVRLGAAFAAASGARFTRVHLGPVGCTSGELVCPDTLFTTTLVEEPGSAAAPPYLSLDLFAEWSRNFRSAQIGVTVQIKNVLRRQNAMTYMGTFTGCGESSPLYRAVNAVACDRFHRGLPLLPLVGVYARF